MTARRRPPGETGRAGEGPGGREQESGRGRAVRGELHRTAEPGGEPADDVVRAEHEDRRPEVTAEQHRTHGECADEDRRDGECDERGRHHRGTLVGGAAVGAIVVPVIRGLVSSGPAVVRGGGGGRRAGKRRPGGGQGPEAGGVTRGEEQGAPHGAGGGGRGPAGRLSG